MAIENGQRKGNEGKEANPERRGLKYVLGGAVLTGALMVTGAACGGSAQQTPAPETGYTEMRANPNNKMRITAQAAEVRTMGPRVRSGVEPSDVEANREVAEALVEGGRAVGMTPEGGRGVTNPWNTGDAGEAEDAGSADAIEGSDAGTSPDGRGVTNPWNVENADQDAGTSETDAGESSDADAGGRGATNPWGEVRERMAQIVEGCRSATDMMDCVEEAALAEDAATIEIKITEGRRIGSAVVSSGDVLFSGTYGEYILKTDFELKVSGTDQNGVSFEIRKMQRVDLSGMEEAEADIILEFLPEIRLSPDGLTTVSSVRINFDGTRSGDTSALDELGLRGISVERTVDGKARVTLPPAE